MSTENNPQNYPQNLELSEWLRFSLSSYNEITRQVALEEMTVNGVNSELIPLLTEISEKDPSQNCQSQAKWLLKLKETKSALKTLIKQLDITPDFISLQIQKGDFAKIKLLSQMLRKSPQTSTILQWREALQKSTEPHLLQVGLEILCKYGDESDANLALNYIQNKDSQVACSALSLLAQKNKDLFIKNIKFGLGNKSADVILHSLHLLRSIDEPEAIKYLSVLILNKNPLVRQKALREFMLIKFEKVENLLWQYLGREDQPLLLVKAGLLATFNPALHFPSKIYDIMSVATGVKKHILQMILKQTIATANAAGLLKNKDLNTYLNEIKQYIANKKAEQNIRINIANLKASEVAIRADAVEKLSKYITNTQIKTLLLNQFKEETDEGIKSYLASIFEDELPKEAIPNEAEKVASNKESDSIFVFPSITPEHTEEFAAIPTAEAPEKSINSNNINSFPDLDEFLKLPSKEQKALIKKVNSLESYHVGKKTLLSLIDSDLKKNILLEVIKTIGDYGKPEDAKAIYHLTKSEDNSIVAQTVKSVASIDLDRILPELNIFLSHEDPRVKSAAFEVYTLADKQAAVQYVGTMIKNTSDSVRRIGLSLIPQLDYPSAEPLLWWMLDHEQNKELQDQVGYMIAANPTKDGIEKLYEFTHDNNGEIKKDQTEMWNVALISAENVFGTPKEEIEKSCLDNLITLGKEESQEKSEYKFKSVMGENKIKEEKQKIKATTNTDDNLFEKIILHIVEFKFHYSIAFFSFIMFIYFIQNGGNNPNKINRANKKEIASEAKFFSDDEDTTEKTTQVGGKDWTGGRKSNAGKIIRSAHYAQVIRTANIEQQQFREEAKKAEKAYFAKLANDPAADQDDRDWAKAKLNENYNLGESAYQSGNYDDAMRYLEAAINDPSFNSYGRVQSMQMIMDICDQRQDKKAYVKWLGKLLKEAKNNIDGFQQIAAFDDFENIYNQIQDVSKKLKSNPQAQEAFIAGMKDKYKFSDEEAQKALEDLMNMKDPFTNDASF